RHPARTAGVMHHGEIDTTRDNLARAHLRLPRGAGDQLLGKSHQLNHTHSPKYEAFSPGSFNKTDAGPDMAIVPCSSTKARCAMARDWTTFCSTSRIGNPSRLRSEEHTSELQSREKLVCRLLLEKKKNTGRISTTD